MRLVLALIQPTKLAAVQDALARIGVERMTVCDALGYGRQGGDRALRSGTAGDLDQLPTLLRKVALEIAVNEDFLERTVDTIVRVARSGQEGSHWRRQGVRAAD